MRDQPLIPKLEVGEWQFYSKTNEDGTKDGSVIAFQTSGRNKNLGRAYCLAKQPKLQEDGKWETHAKAMTAIPDMLKYLIEEYYRLSESDEQRWGKRIRELETILKKAGCFDEDLY